MNFIESFRSFIHSEQLFSPGQQLLLAVSGGIDSAVLCALCHECGFSFEMAHCNFQLRGEESQRDEAFVKSLAEKYDVKIWIKRFDTAAFAAAQKLSIQEAARELRYNWFQQILVDEACNAGVIATAHHLDDAAETSLMNYFKGTGIAGLRGIMPKQGNIIRPLLFTGREKLRQFAISRELTWVEDSSNASDKYSRNYLRHHIIPAIQQAYPQAGESMRSNMQRFREVEVLYRQAIAIHKKKLLIQKGEETHIAVRKLQLAAPLQTVVYEIIRGYGFTPAQTADVISLLHSESGRFIQSSTHRIIRNRNWLIITQLRSERPSLILLEEPGMFEFPAGRIAIRKVYSQDGRPDTAPSVACVNADMIRFPLILRPWKNGDYFYPLGMRRKKKLARFFIDQKMSATDKENTWVLEMDKKIIWIVGKRIDERFRMKNGPGEILKMEVWVGG